MNDNQTTSTGQKSLYIKAIVVAVLILLMMIPATMINTIVHERESRQQQAIDEVSSKWGGAQTFTGPVVSIPFIEYYTDSTKKVLTRQRFIHVLPDALKLNGEMMPEKRNRGVYDIVVYNSRLNVSGSFSNLTANMPNVPRENIRFDEAFVTVGISDLRGIEEQVALQWNDTTKPFNSGVETQDVIAQGISTRVPLSEASEVYKFSFDLTLKGSQLLHVVPVGRETEVTMRSTWSDPSFEGSFLPDKREVTAKGFNAVWKVLHLNREYPQLWLDAQHNVTGSAFGINLLLPVDSYMKTHRAIKYAVLFVGLTFLIFFFLELLNNVSIHPLQYILIGIGLCLFYLLLLSMSEHIGYDAAYAVASLMTIALIGTYTHSILKQVRLSTLVTGTLIILYGFIFTIIQLQDYALLMGSLGLFVTLAVVMYFSRKIEWNRLGTPSLSH